MPLFTITESIKLATGWQWIETAPNSYLKPSSAWWGSSLSLIKTLAPTRIYACLANALYYILPIYQIVHLEAIFVKKKLWSWGHHLQLSSMPKKMNDELNAVGWGWKPLLPMVFITLPKELKWVDSHSLRDLYNAKTTPSSFKVDHPTQCWSRF